MRYPAGKYREEHRDPETGEERYALITGNLYGLPTSARVFSQERDRLLLEELPKRHPGVKVEQMIYEPCLYKVTRHGVGFICSHVDDNDGTFEKPEDAKWWTEATNELFKSEKSPGIKVVNADYMLGVKRTLVVRILAIRADIDSVIIDAKSGIGPRRALAWVVGFRG